MPDTAARNGPRTTVPLKVLQLWAEYSLAESNLVLLDRTLETTRLGALPGHVDAANRASSEYDAAEQQYQKALWALKTHYGKAGKTGLRLLRRYLEAVTSHDELSRALARRQTFDEPDSEARKLIQRITHLSDRIVTIRQSLAKLENRIGN